MRRIRVAVRCRWAVSRCCGERWDGSGRAAGGESKTGAAQKADTSRAETETEQERAAGHAQDDDAQGEDAPRSEGKGEA